MEDGIFISHIKYAKNITKKFGLENEKSKRIHDATHLKISKDDEGEAVNLSLYGSMIGSLLYLMASWPNIAFSLAVCARYQANPKTSHLS